MPARMPKANLLATECYFNLAAWPSSLFSFTLSPPPLGFKEHPAAPATAPSHCRGRRCLLLIRGMDITALPGSDHRSGASAEPLCCRTSPGGLGHLSLLILLPF